MWSVFSCACWPFVHILWRNVCSNPLPILNWVVWVLFVFLNCRSSLLFQFTFKGFSNITLGLPNSVTTFSCIIIKWNPGTKSTKTWKMLTPTHFFFSMLSLNKVCFLPKLFFLIFIFRILKGRCFCVFLVLLWLVFCFNSQDASGWGPFIYLFNWRIIALQNFVIFCQTSKWSSHRYTYSPPSWTSLPEWGSYLSIFLLQSPQMLGLTWPAPAFF